jgi:hypothetical protein
VGQQSSTNGDFVVGQSGTTYQNNGVFYGNGEFGGTVFAQNIEGDVTDSIVKTSTSQVWSNQQNERQILSFTVSAQPFERILRVESVHIEAGTVSDFYVDLRTGGISWDGLLARAYQTTSALVVRPLHDTIPANTSRSYTVHVNPISSGNAIVHSQKIQISTFKSGSNIS